MLTWVKTIGYWVLGAACFLYAAHNLWEAWSVGTIPVAKPFGHVTFAEAPARFVVSCIANLIAVVFLPLFVALQLRNARGTSSR